jgi:hypothetical protein
LERIDEQIFICGGGKIMANFVNTIDLLGDEATAEAIISRKITEFRDDALPTVRMQGLSYCDFLTSVDLPNATEINGSAFEKCTSLKSVNLPSAVNFVASCFSNCTSLERIVLPKGETIGNNTFNFCSKLEFVDLPSAKTLGNQAFGNSYKLKVIILRQSAVCSIASIGAISATGVKVYVPYDWIDAYENATNWSSLVSQGKVTFEALEGSGYD